MISASADWLAVRAHHIDLPGHENAFDGHQSCDRFVEHFTQPQDVSFDHFFRRHRRAEEQLHRAGVPRAGEQMTRFRSHRDR